jgi:hypothetical protein
MRVPMCNDWSLGAIGPSALATAAPLQQSPDKPQNVVLLGDSDTSLRVPFNQPNDGGGGMVTKHKSECSSSMLLTGGAVLMRGDDPRCSSPRAAIAAVMPGGWGVMSRPLGDWTPWRGRRRLPKLRSWLPPAGKHDMHTHAGGRWR